MNLRQIIDQDQGLGDTIKRVTKALGIKPCTPCERRAQRLNEKFSYRKGQDEKLRTTSDGSR